MDDVKFCDIGNKHFERFDVNENIDSINERSLADIKNGGPLRSVAQTASSYGSVTQFATAPPAFGTTSASPTDLQPLLLNAGTPVISFNVSSTLDSDRASTLVSCGHLFCHVCGVALQENQFNCSVCRHYIEHVQKLAI